MRYVVHAVRTVPVSSSVSKTVSTSGCRWAAFMLKIVSTSWRLRPNFRDAVIDVGAALADRAQGRRAAGPHRALGHRRLHPVDDGQHELGRAPPHRRMR